MRRRKRRFGLVGLLLATAASGATVTSTSIDSLEEPAAVAVGANGSIYVCESLGHRVSVFDRAGRRLRAWGRFGRGAGELDGPHGVAVAEDGQVYVADTGNHRIEVFDAGGAFVRQWGRHGTGPGEFDEPQGLAASGDRIYVADSRNNRIQVFRRDGTFLFFVWSFGSVEGAFDRPVGVAAERDGVFYVSDQGNSRIQKFTADGRFALAWGGRGSRGELMIEPSGLDEHEGRLTVADGFTHRLLTFDRSGSLLAEKRTDDEPSSVATLPSGDAIVACSAIENRCRIVPASGDLVAPSSIARDGYGVAGLGDAIVITSRETGVPFVVDLASAKPRVLLTLGGPGREPKEFMRPAGFALDLKKRTLLVSDAGNARIQQLSLSPEFDPMLTRYVGGIGLDDQERLDIEPGQWTLDPATLQPGSMVRDARQRLVIADTAGRRIVVLDDRFHLVGSWGGFGDEDGRFRGIAALATDRTGTIVYVLDDGRRRVQAFDLDGKLLAAWGSPQDGADRLVAPSGIAVGRDGSVFVVDRGANRVLQFDRRGRRLGAFGTTGAGPGELFRPEGIHIDGRNRVIVIDSGNRRAQVFTPAGRVLNEMPLDRTRFATTEPPPGTARPNATTRPDKSDDACRQSIVSNARRYAVCVSGAPALNEPFGLDIQVHDGSARGPLAQNVILDVDGTMPEHHHGMNLKPSVRAVETSRPQELLPGHGALGDGRYEVRGMLFHMPGLWQIEFDITHGAVTERAQLDVVLD